MTPQISPRAPAPEASEILAELNDEQRAAVSHGEGPLMIVAGAGTGKTQVITRRIAWLIATRRARPEQILALTFTEKAAAEMESRVDVLVPYGLVGATIATFNAFCDRMVREHAVELGLTSQLRVESKAEILVFLRERLFDLGLERYLPLGNPDAHLRALYGVFDRARNEDVSPARYAEFALGLAKAAGDNAEKLDRAQAEIEKARAYGRFLDMLMRAGRVDFGAQISLALRLLRERAHLRREYQERFPWILVDEFQDTNHVQFELIRLLAGPERNVTVVGDDDQSIYRFRGAKVENLIEFTEIFPGARTVLLRRNYRSGQSILDLAHRLIQHNNPERLEVKHAIDKRLHSERRGADGGAFAGVVERRAFLTASDQADTVAGEILDALAAGSASASDFAILARAHNHLDAVALALKARGVCFRRVGSQGLYSRPEVQLCLNMLRAVASPDEGPAVYMVLGDPLFGADPVDLSRLGARARDRHRGLLRVAIDAAERDSELDETTREAVRRFAGIHRELSALAIRRPTAEVLYAFVNDSGLLANMVSNESAENLERVQNLNKLFGITSRVGRLLTTDRVNQFIPHLDLLVELGDDPSAVEIEGDEQAVSLLTAHGAKGLEFPVVYLVDLTEQRFPQYPKGDALPFPAELRHAQGDDREDHYREERRLFFVGMTRARDRLVLCHAQDLGGKRAAKPSRFVLEALDLPVPPKGARGATALESIARFAPAPETPAPALAAMEADQTLSLSNSQVESYLACPLQHYFSHVAHVPLPANPTLMYGSAIHHAIKIWHQHRLKRLPIEPRDAVAAYESMWSSEGFLTLAHEERMLAQGREVIERFVRNDVASGETPVAIEMEFRFRTGNDQVIGRWDRIDERAHGIVLVDYKTSEVDEEERAAERAKDSARNGQLGLYALAYHMTREVMPAGLELHFVGSGTVGAVEVAPEHLDRARDRIQRAAAGIRAARFEATPDVRTCSRCDYRQICRFSAARKAS
ncbi:MAG: ATP-dependent DNA helicase [Candidatus Eisenbacteria bacterium]